MYRAHGCVRINKGMAGVRRYTVAGEDWNGVDL